MTEIIAIQACDDYSYNKVGDMMYAMYYDHRYHVDRSTKEYLVTCGRHKINWRCLYKSIKNLFDFDPSYSVITHRHNIKIVNVVPKGEKISS